MEMEVIQNQPRTATGGKRMLAILGATGAALGGGLALASNSGEGISAEVALGAVGSEPCETGGTQACDYINWGAVCVDGDEQLRISNNDNRPVNTVIVEGLPDLVEITGLGESVTVNPDVDSGSISVENEGVSAGFFDLAGACYVDTTSTSAPTTTELSTTTTEAPNDQVCPPLDSGKIDVEGDIKSLVISADEGYLIVGYCVKAGSAKQGLGPEFVTVEPPQLSVEISHSSGKYLSHYSFDVDVDEPTYPTTTVEATTTTAPDVNVTTTTKPEVATTTTAPRVTTTTAPRVTTTTAPRVTTTTAPSRATTTTAPSRATTTTAAPTTTVGNTVPAPETP